jgi:hypothetical protein
MRLSFTALDFSELEHSQRPPVEFSQGPTGLFNQED